MGVAALTSFKSPTLTFLLWPLLDKGLSHASHGDQDSYVASERYLNKNEAWERDVPCFIISYQLHNQAQAQQPVLGTRYLLGFAVDAMHAAARAELVELQPVGVVALVLRTRVVAVLTLGAGQIDDDAVGFLCHCFVPLTRNT